MTVQEVPRRVWRGRRKVMRLQRDLWLAQLALWPTLILSAVLLSVAARVLWQRKSRRPAPGAAPPAADLSVDAPSRAQAGLSG